MKFRVFYSTFCVITAATTVIAQSRSNQPFVNVTAQPSFDASLNKSYSFVIVLIPRSNETDFNYTVFLNAANEFYSSATPGGFIDLMISNTFLTVSCTVVYNYIALNNSVNGDNDVILQTIGNLTYVSEGLLNNSDFSALYDIDNETDFKFMGNQVCNFITCETYTKCMENETAVSIECISICYTTEYCYNGGYCHHHSLQEQPICSCRTASDSWYVGDRCETLLALWMMIVFFVIVFLILLIILPVTWYCIRTLGKRLLKEKEQKEKKILKAALKENSKVTKKSSDKTIKNGKKTGTTATTAQTFPVSDPLEKTPIPPSVDSFDDTSSNTFRSTEDRGHQGTEHESSYVADIGINDNQNLVYNTPHSDSSLPAHNHSRDSSSTVSTSHVSEEENVVYAPPVYTNPPTYVTLNRNGLQAERAMVTTV